MEVERLKNGIFKTTEIKEQHSYTHKKRRSTVKLDAFIIFLVSFLIRSIRIEKAPFVIWDEAHFGKFANYYLNRQFFFDVHPPLGKLLTALSAWIMNINKSFIFASEDVYPESVDYVGMRIFHCLFGSAVPVCGYIILRTLLIKREIAACISVGLIFENALVCTSRYILLDPFLLLFICLSEVFLARLLMHNNRLEYISTDLVCLGISIGCAMSVKWVGLLTVTHVGIYAIYILLQDIYNKRVKVLLMFIRLAITLILVPVTVYMLCFYIHFSILNKSGPGDGEMSSRFQSYLYNNEVLNNDKVAMYGNKVTIRNYKLGTGLLHSHMNRYPSGGQQVTVYPHKDNNNIWRILKVGDNAENVHPYEDLVFHHPETDTYLSVTDTDHRTIRDTEIIPGEYNVLGASKKVISMAQDEMNNSILSNTVFKIEPINTDTVEPLNTFFYVKNIQYNCYLSYSGNKLPKWGYQQGEIICTPEIKNGSVWNIELNQSDTTEKSNIPPKQMNIIDFIRSTVELNLSMNTANNDLTDDGSDTMGTLPIQWLFPKKWLKFNRWDGVVPRFAMLGNVVTWYTGVFSIFSVLVYFIYGIKKTRKSVSKYNTKRMGRVYILLGGWLFHYVPFLFVKRILYLHHYLPCLFFSILSIGTLFEGRPFIAYAYTGCVISCFLYFSSITYGYTGEIEDMPGYELLREKWNIYKG
ncbi:dolichyl-phosphate-mannose-protein mannosyltransferase [Nematocida parisii]|nr:dolichyl-phosphate-mannose-protein mannosyltransferase [Nematocida parisii]KAI5131472.1 dolichyl-phosphate-mannose-protein mannosyltransferase [Nematocida parisii]KAI5145563.1 dolichyl-phosphate-mannose-protein mannosyltransferase [Nematocida parisii]